MDEVELRRPTPSARSVRVVNLAASRAIFVILRCVMSTVISPKQVVVST